MRQRQMGLVIRAAAAANKMAHNHQATGWRGATRRVVRRRDTPSSPGLRQPGPDHGGGGQHEDQRQSDVDPHRATAMTGRGT